MESALVILVSAVASLAVCFLVATAALASASPASSARWYAISSS
jgi:hypothetical protein